MRDILGEREVVDAQKTDECAVEASGLVAEEMLHEARRRVGRGRRNGIRESHGCFQDFSEVVVTPRWQSGTIERTSMTRPYSRPGWALAMAMASSSPLTRSFT